MGTPWYMPPEQFEDSKGVDERADVFALGVMLFQALTGELPFTGRTPTEISRRHDKVKDGREPMPSPLKLVPSLPESLCELCARAIELERERRLASVSELVSELERHQGPAGVLTVVFGQTEGRTAQAATRRAPFPA
jgi:serine/threonine-protein kinase